MGNSSLQSEAILRQLWNHLIASISNDVGRVIGSVLNPLLQLLSSVLILVSLVATLLAIDSGIAMGAGLVIALLYAVAMATGKRPLQQLEALAEALLDFPGPAVLSTGSVRSHFVLHTIPAEATCT